MAGDARLVEARRRADLADARGRPRARPALLLDRQRRRPTSTAASAPGDNLFTASIVAHRREDRQVPLALPAGAPRHLGLRRAEPGRALRRRTAQEGDRRSRQDRLALPARPRDRQAARCRSRERPCRRTRSRRPRRRSRSRATRRSSPHERRATRTSPGRRSSRRPPRRAKPVQVVNGKRIFTPFGLGHHGRHAGPAGRRQLAAVRYNPDTNIFYVCAQSTAWRLHAPRRRSSRRSRARCRGELRQRLHDDWLRHATRARSPRSTRRPARSSGSSAGRSRATRAPTTTAGNLVFVGRNNGELQAYDAEDGDLLWSFQTGAGANTTATVFEHGRQGVRRLLRGRQLAGRHRARRQPLALLARRLARPGRRHLAPATAIEHAGETPNATSPRSRPRAARATATRRPAEHLRLELLGLPRRDRRRRQRRPRPDLERRRAKNLAQVVEQVANGGGGMPAFKGQLSDQQINDVATYVTTKISKK